MNWFYAKRIVNCSLAHDLHVLMRVIGAGWRADLMLRVAVRRQVILSLRYFGSGCGATYGKHMLKCRCYATDHMGEGGRGALSLFKRVCEHEM